MARASNSSAIPTTVAQRYGCDRTVTNVPEKLVTGTGPTWVEVGLRTALVASTA